MADIDGAFASRTGHIETRPSWACQACGQPWPCEAARRELAAVLKPAQLRIHMWLRMEFAAEDELEPNAPGMFRRFLSWTP